jgi:hypothetical protein
VQVIKWSNHALFVVASTIGEENDCLQTGARSARSAMNPTDGQEVLWRPSDGPVPIIVWYRASFSTVLAPQQQLRYHHLFVSVHPSGNHKCPLCDTSCTKQTMVQSSICISVWMTLKRTMQGELPWSGNPFSTLLVVRNKLQKCQCLGFES